MAPIMTTAQLDAQRGEAVQEKVMPMANEGGEPAKAAQLPSKEFIKLGEPCGGSPPGRTSEEPEPEPKAANSPSSRTSHTKTLIIFDWDDTLLCTTFLQMLNSNDVVPELALQRIQEVERSAARLLKVAARLGDIVIVTNSAEGWVTQSARQYCPSLLLLLDKALIVSSRTVYGKKYPCQASRWKLEAFADLLRQPRYRGVTNVVSVGDSPFEWEAAKALEEVGDACVQNVKFKKMPSPTELCRELRSLAEHLETIAKLSRGTVVNLDLQWTGAAQMF